MKDPLSLKKRRKLKIRMLKMIRKNLQIKQKGFTRKEGKKENRPQTKANQSDKTVKSGQTPCGFD